jgi:hypothetical protein
MTSRNQTSVAVEYAHRHLAEVGAAWKFPAEDATVIAAGFAELAAQLGAQDLPGSRDPVASVHAVLAAYPADWLLCSTMHRTGQRGFVFWPRAPSVLTRFSL